MSDIKDELRQWFSQHNQNIVAEDITDDTELIKDRIITSIQVMELMLFIEEKSNQVIDLEKIKKGSFASVNNICSNFFSEELND